MSKISLSVLVAGGNCRSMVECAELFVQFDLLGSLEDSLPIAEKVLFLSDGGYVSSPVKWTT